MNQRCIIIGMSHAGIHLATALRQQGWQGEIMMIGNEALLPYHRPPLSKAYLKDHADVTLIHPESNFEKFQIQYRLNTQVTAISVQEKQVILDSGERLSFDKLALCTGARVRRLNIAGASLEGVHYLRDINDAQHLRKDLANAKKVVIIGAGFIGLEIAAVLNQCGLQVDILEAGQRILARNLDEEMSAYFMDLHARHGVNIHTDVEVIALHGKTRIEKVSCADGREYVADAVIVGIGVVPNAELAAEAGLLVDNGIVVNEYAQSSHADIVAAGDCTFFPSAHLKRSIRLECLANAADQARVAVATLCDQQIAHQAVPWFWSEQYTQRLQIAGLCDDFDQVIERQHTNGSFSRLYLQGQQLLMSVCINAPQDFIASKQLIAQQAYLDLSALKMGNDLKSCVLKQEVF